MAFEARLVSPAGVEVPVGSAAEAVNLRARGYRPVKSEPDVPETPEAAVAVAEAEVTSARTQAEKAKTDLTAARKSAAASLDAANTELSKSK